MRWSSQYGGLLIFKLCAMGARPTPASRPLRALPKALITRKGGRGRSSCGALRLARPVHRANLHDHCDGFQGLSSTLWLSTTLLMWRGEAHRGAPALMTSHSKHALVC